MNKLTLKTKENQQWAYEINENDRLQVSDDIDSIFSAVLLNKLFGCKITSYYDFTQIYFNNLDDLKSENMIGVDISYVYNRHKDGIRTFDNHVSKKVAMDTINPRAVNVNVYENLNGYSNSYYDKFCGSTLIQIISLYDCWDLLIREEEQGLTDKQLAILLAIDSTHLGKFKGYESYDMWREYVGLERFDGILKKYSLNAFNHLINEIKLNSKIEYKNGKWITKVNLEYIQQEFPMLDFDLSSITFNKVMPMGERGKVTGGTMFDCLEFSGLGSLYSFAATGKQKYLYTKFPDEVAFYETNSK